MAQTFNVGSRSLFVTTTAWIFIVLSALGSVFAVLQNAAVASLMPGGPAAQAHLPLLTGLLFGYLPWVAGTAFMLSVATLASAIGLLLRLEWARRSFIGLLVLAIVMNLLGLWLQHEVVQSVVDQTLAHTTIPAQALGVFGGFVTAARVMALMFTLFACALLAWIIRRLNSASVRQEFA